MSDIGARIADNTHAMITARLRRIYRTATNEIKGKLNQYLEQFEESDKAKQALVESGEMTAQDYRNWRSMQIFVGKQWADKLEQAAQTLADANGQALRVINDQKINVFAENANFAAYQIEKGTNAAASFSLYDKNAVGNLMKNDPTLLPEKELDEGKDIAWNMQKLRDSVTQAIIQGDSIPELADRIARDTGSSDFRAMVRTARTAMTSAQNAGRMQTLHDAEDMGISVRKKWLATMDSRTREAHVDLDGQEAEIDEPFDSELGPIMFPGDPSASPANVYNCRCTLTYVYPGYSGSGSRMTYDQWLEAKENKSRGW